VQVDQDAAAICCIEDPTVIRRILEHVECAGSPELKLPPARAPP
jgi:hypothetical protein